MLIVHITNCFTKTSEREQSRGRPRSGYRWNGRADMDGYILSQKLSIFVTGQVPEAGLEFLDTGDECVKVRREPV